MVGEPNWGVKRNHGTMDTTEEIVQKCTDNVLTMYGRLWLGPAHMEFDWADLPFEWEGLTSKDVEESFEDPFSCKFLDSPRFRAIALF